MTNFTVRRKAIKTGVVRDEARRRSFQQRLSPVPYTDEIFLQSANVSGVKSQWTLIEDFCWLHVTHIDAWGREEREGASMPYLFLKDIGMSSKDALTDEDEFVLQFGTEDEKRALIESISLTSQYRLTKTGIQRQVGETWEDVLLDNDIGIEELGVDDAFQEKKR
jgi:hypothetical protein